jgi:DNA-binding CsgD family transcriptional regulator
MHFLLGVDREAPLPSDETKVARLLADLQLAAVHAQDAAVRLFSQAERAQKLPALTKREIEILTWSKNGKSAAAVATILGISERTVTFHVQNILGKYDCESKLHAIRMAMDAGVI